MFVLWAVLVALAGTRFYYHDELSKRMDIVLLALVLAAFFLWIIPWAELWERLTSVSVGAFGISLQEPHVRAAIIESPNDEEWLEASGLSFSEEDIRRNLSQRLKRLEDEELPAVRRSRVLWIDDNPHRILGERRLLRALGIDVTPAASSERAEEILEEDNDFELIITDVQRFGTSYEHVGRGKEIPEGVNFVVKLRKAEDEHIRSLPVIFYAAYPWGKLDEYTRPARELQPEPEVSNSVHDLIPKVIRRLYEEKENRMAVSGKKPPTSV